ncbi:hypothetical protein [Mycobacteroides abscessus]|uniref:hypothetical protein n=1 Tax=Mycobacteroides abscessus TaxID=36809 RepID=UPI0009D34021|nr:hypothetical protein [Mycobacteroides abscessus]SLH42044.1 Uncharacterised protein [Mycobacteroides abscessus subsp. massiliense]
MSGPMTIEGQAISQSGQKMGGIGRKIGSDLQSAVGTDMAPLPASSPMGSRISQAIGSIQGQMSNTPMFAKAGAEGLDNGTQSAVADIEGEDKQSAGEFQGGTGGTNDGGPSGNQALSGGQIPGELDPKSIDEEAKQKAKEMLGGKDQDPSQMFSKILETMGQAGGQLGQQLGQQFQQAMQQFNQMASQGMQQVSQMASKAAESAAAEASNIGSGLGGLGASGLGEVGGGGLGGVGAGLGDTVPAGGGEPVAPMTTSTQLTPNGVGPAAPAGGAANGAGARGGTMPFMPMHPQNKQGDKDSIKRDPAIFASGPVYEGPKGVEQNFGKNPEILSEEPPFGKEAGN